MITINLLPVRETRKQESERKSVFILGGVLAGTLVVIVAVHVTISSKVGRVMNQIESTQAEIDELSTVIGDVASFKKDKEEIEEKLAVGHTPVALAISPDGRFIVSASWDSTVKVWDAQAFEEQAIAQGHTREVKDCAVSPDGSFIVSASEDEFSRT